MTLRISSLTGGPILLAILVMLFAGCRAHPPGDGAPQFIDVVVADSVAGRATAAVDVRTGSVFVAYAANYGDLTDIYLSRIDDDAESIAGTVRVNDAPGDAAAHLQAPAQVALGADGSVYVAWIAQAAVEGRRFPSSDVRLARSEDGARTFSPAITVNPHPGFPTSHHFHDLTVGPDGTVYVSWLDATARDGATSALDDGQSASPLRPSASDLAHLDGHAHSQESGLPGTELHLARSHDGGRSFEPPVVVARGTCQCCRTALAVDAAGTVYVAWRHIFDDLGRDVAIARSTDGGRTFSTPVRVHEDDWDIEGCPHAGPALAVDEQERLHVAWYTGKADRAGVYYASSQDHGDTFSSPVALISDVPIAQVSAARDTDGASLAWENPRGNEICLMRASAVPPDTLAALCTKGGLPALASGNDRTVLAWTREGTVFARIRTSRRQG